MPAAAPGDAPPPAHPSPAPSASAPASSLPLAPAPVLATVQAAPSLSALGFSPCATAAPVRWVVNILQGRIAAIEKQAKLKSKPTKDQNDQKPPSPRPEDISLLLEFAWDLTKQVMGIAVLSENEAKKQARKDNALRKSQDLQLIHEVLVVLACLEQINNPANRANLISGTCGTPPISLEDVQLIDNICPELTPKPVTEEGTPSFRDRTMNAAKHLLAIIEGDTKEVFGTTYAHIKTVVSNVQENGYFDKPKEPIVDETEEPDLPLREDPIEDPEHAAPPLAAPIVAVNPPPPAPQAVPTPAFSILPPRAPPVTLQQVEHAYFAQQYGHQQQQQHQPVPEVFGPQSFIFIQDSELDSADISQQPTPRPTSPAAIPSQTFTNQSFTIPQHFPPEMPPNPHLPLGDIPQTVHYPTNVNDVQNAIANFSTANPPPPIPMPPSHPPIPPHMAIPAGQVVAHPQALQQRLPSPSFQQNMPFKPQAIHPSESLTQNQNENNPDDNTSATPVEQEPVNLEWIDDTQIENRSEQLEIDEWNPETAPSDPTTQTNGPTIDKFRPRGRGRGNGSSNFRGRGTYQNGRSGSYYRNNENGQPNNTVNGERNYDNNYRENRNDTNRFDNYQGNYRGRGSGGNTRGMHRQNGAPRGAPRNGQARGTGGARSQYIRKPANNQFEARNGETNNKQTFAH